MRLFSWALIFFNYSVPVNKNSRLSTYPVHKTPCRSREFTGILYQLKVSSAHPSVFPHHQVLMFKRQTSCRISYKEQQKTRQLTKVKLYMRTALTKSAPRCKAFLGWWSSSFQLLRVPLPWACCAVRPISSCPDVSARAGITADHTSQVTITADSAEGLSEALG